MQLSTRKSAWGPSGQPTVHYYAGINSVKTRIGETTPTNLDCPEPAGKKLLRVHRIAADSHPASSPQPQSIQENLLSILRTSLSDSGGTMDRLRFLSSHRRRLDLGTAIKARVSQMEAGGVLIRLRQGEQSGFTERARVESNRRG